jgi:exonuclease III
MLILGHPLASCRTTKVEEATMGRWTETYIKGKRNRKVTIIAAYVVCSQSQSEISTKMTTAFTQQWHIIKRSNPGTADIDPRKKMWEDLATRIIQLKDSGNEIIVTMDANDSLQQLTSELNKFVRKCELVDIIYNRHGTFDKPPTHSRGSKRIDYILTTPTIAEYVCECGILPFHDLCFSDHRPLYADIDIKAYLRYDPPDNVNRIAIGVNSNDPRSIQSNEENMEKALNDSQIESNVKEVLDSLGANNYQLPEIHEKLEYIDTIFTKIKIDCEKMSENKHKLPWSPKLRNAYHTRLFWSLWLSQS